MQEDETVFFFGLSGYDAVHREVAAGSSYMLQTT
jgi:hypothetical protein